MGTNYYQRTDICECCNRYKEKHIGKNSMGWQFSFQGYTSYDDNPKIKSFEDWKRELQADGKIFDEYGRELTFEEFVELVESKNKAPNNHYDYCKKEAANRGYDMLNDWKDDEGYSFSGADFS
jgi:hypothetical protein